jgi:hypothetical protein
MDDTTWNEHDESLPVHQPHNEHGQRRNQTQERQNQRCLHLVHSCCQKTRQRSGGADNVVVARTKRSGKQSRPNRRNNTCRHVSIRPVTTTITLRTTTITLHALQRLHCALQRLHYTHSNDYASTFVHIPESGEALAATANDNDSGIDTNATVQPARRLAKLISFHHQLLRI